MGPRFLPAVGNAELVNAERVEGPALFTNPDSQERPKALQQIEAFLNRPPRTIGETFPNAERSSADPMRRRRVPLDGPMFQALAEIATRFDRPLPAHMEWHPESVAGLGRLLERWPGLSLVLSHCGKITKAQDIRVFLEKHPKVVRALREGLLAQLDPSVVERVAHGNARRVFKLAP
jgi:predicted TIM-barrel fold metal-dependent hydrolase